MRKKIIKFYFFKSLYKNPSVNYMFAFSKRAIKQSRKLTKLKKRLHHIKSVKKKTEVLKYALTYKKMIQNRIFLNQWLFSIPKLRFLFIHSFFYNIFLVKFNKNKYNNQVNVWQFWFVFKNQFYKFMRRFMKLYLRFGFLSSHFVHIFSKKNLTYQTRSKFRTQVMNLNMLTKYGSDNSKSTLMYKKYLYKLLYFLTINHTQRKCWVDENFMSNVSVWNYIDQTIVPNAGGGQFNCQMVLNPQTFNVTTFNKLTDNRELIFTYFNTTDKQQQDNLRNKLIEVFDTSALNYIYGVKLCNNEISPTYVFESYIFFMYRYIYLYKATYKTA